MTAVILTNRKQRNKITHTPETQTNKHEKDLTKLRQTQTYKTLVQLHFITCYPEIEQVYSYNLGAWHEGQDVVGSAASQLTWCNDNGQVVHTCLFVTK